MKCLIVFQFTNFGQKMHLLRCDNGGEYMSNKFKVICKREGVNLEYTSPYSHESNGVAERMNWTVSERAKAILTEEVKRSCLAEEVLGEAVYTVTYLTNRSPTNALNNKTQYEMWNDRKPDLTKLRVFVWHAYSLIIKEKRSKFEGKTL